MEATAAAARDAGGAAAREAVEARQRCESERRRCADYPTNYPTGRTDPR